MDKEAIIVLTADIVSAHVGNNSVAAADMAGLIQSVYNALAGAVEPPPAEEVMPQPAVSIRSSVKSDAIACLECGAKLKMLKRHLSRDHGLTPDAYKKRWQLPSDYPLVAPEYAARRKELALKIGLGRKAGSGRKRANPKNTAAARK